MNKTVLTSFTILCLLSTIFLMGFSVQTVKASGTIYIRVDGSVDPPTANITSVNNVTYTFTGDINDDIVVERSNIIINGNGYTLQGSGGLIPSKDGISLSERNNVTIRNMKIREFNNGIWLNMSSSNTIYGNNITDNRNGILLDGSQSNTIAENSIIDNLEGIWLWDSSNNIIVGNNITENDEFGVYFSSSKNNLLRNNHVSANEYNFHVSSSFMNDVDVSNTVDGKPIYYWIEERDKTVPLDAGYIALVNCTRITVKNLSLTNNGQGLLLANTNNSKIVNNKITNNFFGMNLDRSSNNNTISRNNITNNGIGVSLSSNNTISENNIINSLGIGIMLEMGSSNIIISRNNIANNQLGIQIMVSSNNTISENNIADNRYGIQLNSGDFLGYSSNNTIHHNNFIGNTQQVWVIEVGDIPPSAYTNFWDVGYPSGGNYWSDYNGVDLNHDGIGDMTHFIDANNTDCYPLTSMFTSFNTSLGHHVNVISNSTIEDFEYFESNSTIRMYVSGEEGFGFSRVCIPYTLMDVSNISVIIDDGLTPVLYHNYTLYDNDTHRWIYFAYEHSIHEIDIIPEFPSLLILPLFMIATLLAFIIYGRKHSM